MKRLMTTSIIFFFLIPICPFVIAEERYRGRIHHYGRYSDIYLSKDEDSIDSMNKLLDAIRKIEEIRDLRERRELKRRYELERKRLEKKHQTEKNRSATAKYLDKDNNYRSTEKPLSNPFPVFFKSGKKIFCDQSWRDENTIFLVIHGKKVAIGYGMSEIDMEKSFGFK